MSAIGPGDFVECIELCPFAIGGEAAPSPDVGQVCQVEEVIPAEEFDDNIAGLILREFPGRYSDGDHWCYEADCFRPIYRPDERLIQNLLKPVSEPELA